MQAREIDWQKNYTCHNQTSCCSQEPPMMSSTQKDRCKQHCEALRGPTGPQLHQQAIAAWSEFLALHLISFTCGPVTTRCNTCKRAARLQNSAERTVASVSRQAAVAKAIGNTRRSTRLLLHKLHTRQPRSRCVVKYRLKIPRSEMPRD